MAVADHLSGHDVDVVDTGLDGGAIPGKPGQKDERGGSIIETVHQDTSDDADVLIAHSGVPDPWISHNQAPVIWVLHGRPKACFSPEQFGRGHSYTLMANIAKWPRVKAMTSFWPDHTPFWKPIIPEEKLRCMPAPPVDNKRFSPDGPLFDFETIKDKFNVVICESWREDVDIYELAHGAIEMAKETNGEVKFTFFSMEGKATCWNFLKDELKRLDALGWIWDRRTNMQEVYRAADLILSPQKITTRTICEPLCCGTPVLADDRCKYATYGCVPDEPISVRDALMQAKKEITENKEAVKQKALKTAEAFSLSLYSDYMNEVYAEITK